MKYLSITLICIILLSCSGNNFERENIGALPEEDNISFQKVSDTPGGGEFFFSNFRDMLITTDQEIILSDWALQTLLRFDGEGNYLGQIGNEGQGPGEFTDIRDLVLTPDDTLHVFDRNNSRHQIFAREDGGWDQVRERMLRQGYDETIHSYYPLEVLDKKNDFSLARFRNNIGIRDTTRIFYEWLAWVDENLQSVHKDILFFKRAESAVVKRDEVSLIVNTHPNGYKLFTQYDHEESVIHQADNEEAVIRKYSPDGELLQEIKLPTEITDVDKEEKNDYLARMRKFYDAETMRRADELYLEHQPFIRQLLDTGLTSK